MKIFTYIIQSYICWYDELARSWPFGLSGGVSVALRLKSLETSVLENPNKQAIEPGLLNLIVYFNLNPN